MRLDRVQMKCWQSDNVLIVGKDFSKRSKSNKDILFQDQKGDEMSKSKSKAIGEGSKDKVGDKVLPSFGLVSLFNKILPIHFKLKC